MKFFIFLNFIKKYLLRNPLFTIVYCITYFIKSFSQHVTFYSKQEVKKILTEGKSLMRFGDGEIHLLLGKDIGHEYTSSFLRKKYTSIIQAKENTDSYVIAINEKVMNQENWYLKQKNKMRLWHPMRVWYFLYFSKKYTYVDASLFYYKNSFEHYLLELCLNKRVIIITRKGTIQELKKRMKENKSTLQVEYIETSDTHALTEYSAICKRLDEYLLRYKPSECIILAAFGPGSKVLAWDYCSKVQVIDIGVGLELAYTDEAKDNMLVI